MSQQRHRKSSGEEAGGGGRRRAEAGEGGKVSLTLCKQSVPSPGFTCLVPLTHQSEHSQPNSKGQQAPSILIPITWPFPNEQQKKDLQLWSQIHWVLVQNPLPLSWVILDK